MRCAFAVLAISFGASIFATSAAAADTSAAKATPQPMKSPGPVRTAEWRIPDKNERADRVYRVACAVYERGEDGKDIVLSRPIVATVPHQPAQVQIAQATPLVAGIETTPDGKAKPSITVLTSGIKIEMKIAPDHSGRVAFDVAIEQSAIESVDIVKLPDGSSRQSARIGSKTTRIIETVDLGKKTTVGLDDKDPAKSKRRAEFTVTEMKPEDFAPKPKPRS